MPKKKKKNHRINVTLNKLSASLMKKQEATDGEAGSQRGRRRITQSGDCNPSRPGLREMGVGDGNDSKLLNIFSIPALSKTEYILLK